MNSLFSASSDRVLRLALLAIAVAGPALFLIGNTAEFPMDDAYIHFQYARNLAETGKLTFNPGEARGVGTTSMLWALLLAGGAALGIDPGLMARALGVAALVIATLCVYELACGMLPADSSGRGSRGAFLIALLFALSGHMIWFTLSGMETVQFIAVGLLTLLCYRRGWWAGVGVGIGLAVLCRPEGIGLAPTIALLELIRLRKGGRWEWGRWAIAFALAAIPVGAWLVYIHQATGNWLPTTFSGKGVCHADAMDHYLAMFPALGLYTGLHQVVFVVMWLGNILFYVFGAAAMPGPRLSFTRDVGATVSFDLSIIGVAAALLVGIPLAILGARALFRWLRSADLSQAGALAAAGIWVWAIVHNAAYLLLMPGPGTATRYQAINHLLLWWLVALGLMSLRHRRRLFTAMAIGLAVIVLADVAYWRGTYTANLDHMRSVRIEAAGFLAHELPPGARVAAYDIGALGYFGGHPIVDLGGLLDREFSGYQAAGKVDQYLRDRGAEYMALPARHSTDREALWDFAQYLHIDRSPLYELDEIAVFENARDVWYRGFAATFNYQPSVRIYRIKWRKGTE